MFPLSKLGGKRQKLAGDYYGCWAIITWIHVGYRGNYSESESLKFAWK